MKKSDKEIIEKMIEYAKDSIKYTEYLNYESFIDDDRTLVFSCFSLAQLSEVAMRLSDDFKAKHKNIPWHEIRGMRNKIIHDYIEADKETVFDTIKNDIPKLIANLEEIREKL